MAHHAPRSGRRRCSHVLGQAVMHHGPQALRRLRVHGGGRTAAAAAAGAGSGAAAPPAAASVGGSRLHACTAAAERPSGRSKRVGGPKRCWREAGTWTRCRRTDRVTMVRSAQCASQEQAGTAGSSCRLPKQEPLSRSIACNLTGLQCSCCRAPACPPLALWQWGRGHCGLEGAAPPFDRPAGVSPWPHKRLCSSRRRPSEWGWALPPCRCRRCLQVSERLCVGRH